MVANLQSAADWKSKRAARRFGRHNGLPLVTVVVATLYISSATIAHGGVSIAQKHLFFGYQVVGTTSNPQTIRLQNTGRRAVKFARHPRLVNTLADDYFQISDCPFGGKLRGFQGCTISITFTPQSLGNQVGNLTITVDGSARTIQMSGIGTAPSPTATASPQSSLTPTATPSPTPTAKTLTTSDSLLNTGTAASIDYADPNRNVGVAIVTAKTDPKSQLWQLYPNPWGISSGNGMINMAYSGVGSIITKVNLTGLNAGAVIAYPFIFYGGDPYGDLIGGQPLQFPEQLSAMNSLTVDTSYSLSGIFGGNVDVLFDEWLIPTAAYTGGIGGAVEVEVIPYFSFATGEAGSFVKTVTEPVTKSGVLTKMNFDEYSSGGTGGGNDIIFYPSASQQLMSVELTFNMMDFLNEAATTAGLNSSWWVAGIELGTEFGDGDTENFTFSVTKLQIQQTLSSP